MPTKIQLANFMTLAVVLTAPAIAHSAVIDFSDSVFNEANWSLFELVDMTPNDSAAFVGDQITTGGNPAEYRRVINELNTAAPSQISAGHLRQGATFDPGEDGSFISIDVSLDGFSQNGNPAGAVAYGLLVEQNGSYFQGGLGQVLNGVGWQTLSATGLDESSFSAVDGVSVLDLSDSGSVVALGFFTSNGTFGTPSTNVGGVDNWNVTITATDPPSAVPTLAWPIQLATLTLLLGVAGILLSRRGTDRT